jgi:hypothetical protein
MKLVSTADVSLQDLREVAAELAPELNVDVDESQAAMRVLPDCRPVITTASRQPPAGGA